MVREEKQNVNSLLLETGQAKNFSISSHKIFKSVSALVLKWH